MKAEFDFPRFEDLKLGPVGVVHGCGCLAAKQVEIVSNSSMNHSETIRFARYVSFTLGNEEERRLVSLNCSNTIKNRRKAYSALEYAVKQMGYEIGR